MNRQEVTQYQSSGVGVVEGADLDFGQPPEAPCRDCGAMVDLTCEIIVNVIRADGSGAESKMSEANARALLSQVGIGSPPVLCEQHLWTENEVVLPRG